MLIKMKMMATTALLALRTIVPPRFSKKSRPSVSAVGGVSYHFAADVATRVDDNVQRLHERQANASALRLQIGFQFHSQVGRTVIVVGVVLCGLIRHVTKSRVLAGSSEVVLGVNCEMIQRV